MSQQDLDLGQFKAKRPSKSEHWVTKLNAYIDSRKAPRTILVTPDCIKTLGNEYRGYKLEEFKE